MLLGNNIWVWVEPPLFASVVTITVFAAPVGVIGVTPTKPPSMPFTPFVPTMFAPPKVSVPPIMKISAPLVAVLPMMMLLVMDEVPKLL
jgi:hypothetical protein